MRVKDIVDNIVWTDLAIIILCIVFVVILYYAINNSFQLLNAVNKANNNATDLVSNFNSTTTKQLEKYKEVVHSRDKTILNDLYKELIIPIKLLNDRIGKTINDTTMRTELNNTSQRAELSKFDHVGEARNATYLKYSNNVGQYGLNIDTEQNKRKILDSMISDFDMDMKKLNKIDMLAYMAITTKDCFMYLLEPYNRTIVPLGDQNLERAGQDGLSAGFYPNHPWCEEFNVARTNAALLTDPYYAKSQQQQVISVYFQLPPEGQKQAYIGGALQMIDFINEFYEKHDIDKTNTKLLLRVDHNYDNGKSNLFEFQKDPKPLKSFTLKGLPVAEYANSTLTKEDEARIIKDINEFDSDTTNNWKYVSVDRNSNMSNYAITATTSALDKQDMFSQMDDLNKQHHISWEWIILRKDPPVVQNSLEDLKASVNEANTSSNSLQNTQLLSLILTAMIAACIFYFMWKHYKRGELLKKTKRHKLYDA